MKAYHNSVVLRNDGTDPDTLKDDLNAGVTVPVTVRINATQALADIFDLDENPIANPLSTDNKGNYAFKAGDNVYDVIVSEGTANEVRISKVEIALSSPIDLINDLSQAYEFDTVADMTSSIIVFPVGKVLKRYYYESGDKGYAEGVVKTLGQASLDGDTIDEYYNVTLADGKVWIGSRNNVNTAMFGAKTDGSVDALVNFNANINYLKNLPDPQSRAPMRVTSGTFMLSGKIKPHWGGMVGDGVESTELDFSTCTDDSCVEWGDDVSFNFKGKLADFKVKGNLDTPLQAALKLLKLGTSSTLERITANPCNIGLYIDFCFYTSFRDLNLFGQFNNGQAGDILEGFGIYCTRPVNNLIFENVSVQYFNTAVSIYDDVATTETSNNIKFNKCSFERNSGVVFLLRRTTVNCDTCYTEQTRYNRDPLDTEMSHIVIGELGSTITFSGAGLLAMVGYEESGDFAFDGDCNVSIQDTRINGGSVVRATKPSSATLIKYEGIKRTDLAPQSDFFDASYQSENQNSGGNQFKSAYQLQTGGDFKTLPLYQTDGGGETFDIAMISVFDPFAFTGLSFDIKVTRRNQSNATRAMKYLFTSSRNPSGGAISNYVNDYGGDISDYFTDKLFPVDPNDMFDLTVNDLGSTLEYTLTLKEFNSGSGDATEANGVISCRVEYLTLESPATSALEQRTNMAIVVNNVTS